MAVRVRVTNKTKGTSSLLPPNTTNYTANLGDGTYSFEPVLSLPEEFTVVGVDPAPVNKVLPFALGEPTAGGSVKGQIGEWEGAESFAGQWREGSNAFGPPGYDLSPDRTFMGKTLFLRIGATNARDTTYADSLPVGPFTAAPKFTTQPVLAGTPTAGQPMTATAGAADGFPAPQVAGRIERQLGTTGDWVTVDGGLSGVFVSGYRYRVASFATNIVNTEEAFTTPTAVVAATVAPLAAGSNLPKQTIIQNTGTTAIAADSLFTGKVDTYALVTPPSGFTINATTGAISVNTASLALRTDETITVRASNDTPATLDRTFVIEVVNASGTATVPGAVTLGTVTIDTGPEPGSASVTNVKLPPSGGSPLTNMRLRIAGVSYDYPATLGTHVIRGLTPGAKTGVVVGVNALGPATVWSSPINFTVAAPLQPPVAFSYSTTPEQLQEGQPGTLNLSAQGKDPKTFAITLTPGGVLTPNQTGTFDTLALQDGNYSFTGTITNDDGVLQVSGGFPIRANVPPVISPITLTPSVPEAGQTVTLTFTVDKPEAEVTVTGFRDTTALTLTGPVYKLDNLQAGNHTLTVRADDGIDVTTRTVTFAIGAFPALFNDPFDGTGNLAASPNWRQILGPEEGFVQNGGKVDCAITNQRGIVVAEDRKTAQMKVSGDLQFQSAVYEAGLAACINESGTNGVLLLVSGGSLGAHEMINGILTLKTTYGSVITGGSTGIRFCTIEVDAAGKKFQVRRDGSQVLVPNNGGSETLDIVHTGTLGGGFTKGTVLRNGMMHRFQVETSTLYPPTTAPIEPEPEPEVPPPDPVAQTFSVIPSDTNVRRPTVAADTATYNVTPATYEVTATPVGGGSAIVMPAQSNPRVLLNLPADGRYDLTIVGISSTGVRSTRTAAVRFWCQQNGLVGWHGLNVEGARKSRGYESAPWFAWPQTGKTVEQFDATPVISTLEGFTVNGMMKNPPVTMPNGVPQGTGFGPQGWDGRRYFGTSIVAQLAFQDARVHRDYPAKTVPGDTWSKFASKLDIPKAEQEHRHGLGNQHGALIITASDPGNVFAPYLFKNSVLSNDIPNMSNYDNVLAQFVAMQYTCPVTVTSDQIATLLAVGERYSPAYGLMRGGDHAKDSHEPFIPRNTSVTGLNGNYYSFLYYVQLMNLLMSNKVNADQKRRFLDIILLYAIQADVPGKQPQQQAGIAQNHEAVVMLKRHCEGRSFDDLDNQGGNALRQFFYWNAELLEKLKPHDSLYSMAISRRRSVQTVGAMNANGYFQFNASRQAAYSNEFGAIGDTEKLRYHELAVCRANGEKRIWPKKSAPNSTKEGGNTSGTTMQVYLTAPFDTPLQVGEKIWFEHPPGYKPYAGLPDWNNGAHNYVPYGPSPTTSYRNENQMAGFIPPLTALGIWPTDKNGPLGKMVAMRDYYIRTALPDDTQGYGLLPRYDAPYSQESTLPGSMWFTNAATLGLTV